MQSLLLRDDKDVGNAFFHSDGNDLTHILLLDHLVQTAHVHRVKHWLHDHDLPWWLHIHTLLALKSNVSIFFGVDAINSERVIFRVVLE